MIFLFCFPPSTLVAEEQEKTGMIGKIKDTLFKDYKNFYSKENLRDLAIGLGIAGVFANTSIDIESRDYYQESLRTNNTDNVSKVIKPFGEGIITIPVFIGATILKPMS